MRDLQVLLSYLKRKRRFLVIVAVLLALNFMVWGSVFGLFEEEKPKLNPNAKLV